jgi:phage host-nuclease inhibitor protein Gam
MKFTQEQQEALNLAIETMELDLSATEILVETMEEEKSGLEQEMPAETLERFLQDYRNRVEKLKENIKILQQMLPAKTETNQNERGEPRVRSDLN